jgi:RNA polymerase sigma-70 factor (ECF subfamily)
MGLLSRASIPLRLPDGSGKGQSSRAARAALANRPGDVNYRIFLAFYVNPGAPKHDLTDEPISLRMQPTSDEVLIARIAGGDRLAMQVLFARHHVRVYRFALRLVRNKATAEDLISDVFLDVWRQADKFEGRSAVSTWMLSIARFKALSALRRRQEQELDVETAERIEDQSDNPEVVLAKRDKGAVLQQCLAALSVEHREIIDLVYYHEMSVEEVAKIAGIPEATVKTRMFYARKKLSELLKQRGIDRGWP